MTRVAYYPGCTLKDQALGFEDTSIAALRELGTEMAELSRWNCCGTVFSLSADNLMFQTAPVRNLLRVKEEGFDTVVTLCSMCYNTLKRANDLVREDPEKLEKLNLFMNREEMEYTPDVRVCHLLQYLRDDVGFDAVSKAVKRPLEGLKLAAYYGCLLTRPETLGFDDVENPRSMDDLIGAMGAQPVEYPYKLECCGSYETVTVPADVAERTYRIVKSAGAAGAQAILTSCPLCFYNLDSRQDLARKSHSDLKQIPILYLTQPLALAFGLSPELCRFERSHVDPRPLFEKFLSSSGGVDGGEKKQDSQDGEQK
jgi:heterodisulfide reductase subunit B